MTLGKLRMNSSSVPAQTSQSNNPSTSASAAVASSSPEKKLPSSSSASSIFANNYHDSQMARSTAQILDNIGFTSSSKSAIYILSSIMKKYFESLSRRASTAANSAGRSIVNFSDVAMAFEKMGVNVTELHDYIREVESFGLSKVPLFPVANPREQLTVDVATQSVGTAERREDELLADELHSPQERYVKPQPQRLFPDFFAQPADDLGFWVRAAPAPLPVIAAQVTEEQEPSINPDILNLVDIVLPEKVKTKHKKKDKMKKKHKRHNRSRSRSTERRKERRRAEPPAEDTYMEGSCTLYTDDGQQPSTSSDLAPKLGSGLKLKIKFGTNSSVSSSSIIVTESNNSGLSAPSTSAITTTTQMTSTTFSMSSGSSEGSIEVARNALEDSIISDKDNKLLVANDLLAQPVAVIEPPAKRKKLSTGEVLRKTTDNVAAKVAAAKVSGSNNAKNDAKRAKPVVGAALTAPTTRDSRVSTPLHTTSSVVPTCKDDEVVEKSTTKRKSKGGNAKKKLSMTEKSAKADTLAAGATLSLETSEKEAMGNSTTTVANDGLENSMHGKLPAANDDVNKPIVVTEPPVKRKKLSIGEVLRKTTDNVAAKVAAAKVNNSTSSNGKRAKSVVGSTTTQATKDNSFSTPQRTTSSMSSYKESEASTKSLSKSKSKSGSAKKKTLTAAKTELASLKVTAASVVDNETISSNGGVRPSSAAATDEAVEDEDNVWICPECSVAYVDGAADMVGCDGCDRWFHWHCVGLLISPPENKEWFCHACQKRRKKSSSSVGGYAATPAARPPSATHAKKK